jgi:DNA polymerase-3 subunit delta
MTGGHGAEILQAAAKGEVSPLYVFVGERPITGPLVQELIRILLAEDARDFNLETVTGEAFAEAAVIGALDTMPFFPGRKVVLLRDPPFLRGSGREKSRWSKVVSALANGDDATVKRLVSRTLSQLKLDPSDLLGFEGARLEEVLAWPKGEPIDDLALFLEKHAADLVSEDNGPDSSAGGILAWLSKKRDPLRIVLIIETEFVDRRGAPYRRLKKLGTIVDLEAPLGDKKAGAEIAHSSVRDWLRQANKRIDGAALDMLMAQVGFTDPVALRTECAKLVAHAGSDELIRASDVEKLVSRHREEELFQLTEFLGAGDLGKCLDSLGLLLAQGVHPLAVLQSIANFLRRMVLVRSALEQGPGVAAARNLKYNTFKMEILPEMKIYWGEPAPAVVDRAHPYALYKACQQASRFEKGTILRFFSILPEIDLKMKGGQAPPRVLLEHLILELVSAIRT